MWLEAVDRSHGSKFTTPLCLYNWHVSWEIKDMKHCFSLSIDLVKMTAHVSWCGPVQDTFLIMESLVYAQSL